jgi:hypothetical protein
LVTLSWVETALLVPSASYPRKPIPKSYPDTQQLTRFTFSPQQFNTKTLVTVLPLFRRRLLLVMVTIYAAIRGEKACALRVRVPWPSGPERASGTFTSSRIVCLYSTNLVVSVIPVLGGLCCAPACHLVRDYRIKPHYSLHNPSTIDPTVLTIQLPV